MKIDFGALTPSLEKQLSAQGLQFKSGNDKMVAQKSADGITILTIHGFLTSAESDKARNRLGKRILSTMVEPDWPA